MNRSIDTAFRSPRKTENPTRDVMFIFVVLTLAWASTSCASASVHETCGKAESWEVFGSYEECMAVGADRSRAPAMSENEIQSRPRLRMREHATGLNRW